MSAARDFEIRPADPLSEHGSLREMPLGVNESARPGLNDPEIQQRDSPQLAPHRVRIARRLGNRSVEQLHLFDDFTELTATPRERQPQGRDRHRQTAVVSRGSALDVRLGQRQLGAVIRVEPGESTIAVDTHIFRVGNRTGIAPGKNPLEVELKLEKATPDEFKRHAHHWLILHGRYICKARKPQCWRCPIADICLYQPKTPPPPVD